MKIDENESPINAAKAKSAICAVRAVIFSKKNVKANDASNGEKITIHLNGVNQMAAIRVALKLRPIATRPLIARAIVMLL